MADNSPQYAISVREKLVTKKRFWFHIKSQILIRGQKLVYKSL